MANYVVYVTPQTDAEVNQLVSLLHSQKVLQVTYDTLVSKGKQTVYWSYNNAASLMFEGISEQLKASILDRAEAITVNQLGTYFNNQL